MSGKADVHVPFGSSDGKINDGKVVAAMIGAGAITTAKLADDGVTGPKLATAALGLLVFTGVAAAGPATLTGAVVGDEVVGIVNLSDLTDDVAKFEGTITVVDEIQQTSATDLSTKKFAVLIVPKS